MCNFPCTCRWDPWYLANAVRGGDMWCVCQSTINNRELLYAHWQMERIRTGTRACLAVHLSDFIPTFSYFRHLKIRIKRSGDVFASIANF